MIGAGPPCCTCVIMLPAAAMTYVNPSSGLEPSVYGGGGSPSSRSLLPCRSLVSLGSAAFVSATTELAEASRAAGVVGGWASDSSKGGAGPEGGGEARAVSERDPSDSVTRARYGSSGEGAGKYLEGKLWAEKGGGDSVAEDGSSWRALSSAFPRSKWESTSSLGGGGWGGACPRRELVV